MPPIKLRSHLLALTSGTLLLLAALAAAGWFLTIDPPAPFETEWLIGLLALLAVTLPALLALSLARRIGSQLASLSSIAKRLAAGANAEMPADIRVREIADAGTALAEAAQAARAREAALRGADRAKDEFFAMLGHELRNPLAALANAAYVLKSAASSPEAASQATGVVVRQVQQMTRLVEDLLDIN